jgi:hypothetical protein
MSDRVSLLPHFLYIPSVLVYTHVSVGVFTSLMPFSPIPPGGFTYQLMDGAIVVAWPNFPD